jgi:hypothetical protein
MKGWITMTPEETERKKARRRVIRYCTSTCLCCLIVGFLIGVALDSLYGPNRILLYINPDGKVSVSPQPGDIISFAAFDDKTGKNVSVSYTAGLKPCGSIDGAPLSTCVYNPGLVGPSLYLFGCKSAGGTDYYDPQYGPKCVACGGGPGAGGLFPHPHPTLPLLKVVIWDLGGPFRISPDHQILPQSPGASSGGSQGGQEFEAQVHEVDSSSPPPRAQEFVAACDANKAAIFPSGSTTSTTTPIVAEPGDTITWNPYSAYTIAFDDMICVQSAVASNGNLSCTVKNSISGPHNYTLNMPACTASTSITEKINVQTPMLAANSGSR